MHYKKCFFCFALVSVFFTTRLFAGPPPPSVIIVDFNTAVPSFLVENGFNTNQVSEKEYTNEVLLVVLDVLGNERFAKVEIKEQQNIIQGEDMSETLYPGFYYIVASNDLIYDNKKMIVK